MKSMPCLLLCVFVLTLPCLAQTTVQTINYTDFSSVSGLTMNGSATQMGTILELTPSANYQAGTAWYNTPQPVVWGFDTSFAFRILTTAACPASCAADGMTFAIQLDPLGTSALGQSGGPLAYAVNGAIANSLVIELDTWANGEYGDSSDNEISIHTNGPGLNDSNEMFSLGRITPAANLSDGAIHTLRVLHTPGSLDVFLDNLVTPVLSVPWDFNTGGTWVGGASVGGLALPNQEAYVGFTGSTGGAPQINEVLGWTWSSILPYAPCFEGNVGMSSGGPLDVVRVDGSTGGYTRTVPVVFGSPFSIEVIQPPHETLPRSFILWGHLAYPQPTDQFQVPLNIGTMCIQPYELFGLPWHFTVVDSFSTNPNAALPGTPSPWNVTIPFAPTFPLQVALQGIIQDSSAPSALAVTNAVVMDFVAAPPPVITAVTPLAATAGTVITVSGADFQAGAVVAIDGVVVPLLTSGPTDITFALPSGVVCDATLLLTNTDGQAISTPFNPTPVITNTVFPSGPAAGGALFIITGSNFVAGSTVTIGGAPATVTTSGFITLVLNTPPGVVGPAAVVVTSPGGCTVMTTYTYL